MPIPPKITNEAFRIFYKTVRNLILKRTKAVTRIVDKNLLDQGFTLQQIGRMLEREKLANSTAATQGAASGRDLIRANRLDQGQFLDIKFPKEVREKALRNTQEFKADVDRAITKLIPKGLQGRVVQNIRDTGEVKGIGADINALLAFEKEARLSKVLDKKLSKQALGRKVIPKERFERGLEERKLLDELDNRQDDFAAALDDNALLLGEEKSLLDDIAEKKLTDKQKARREDAFKFANRRVKKALFGIETPLKRPFKKEGPADIIPLF